MARRNISLPDDLDSEARRAGLNVSALAKAAIVAELSRRGRMARFDAWLDELDAEHGVPSDGATRAAEAWIRSAVPAPRTGEVKPSKSGKTGRRVQPAKSGKAHKSR